MCRSRFCRSSDCNVQMPMHQRAETRLLSAPLQGFNDPLSRHADYVSNADIIRIADRRFAPAKRRNRETWLYFMSADMKYTAHGAGTPFSQLQTGPIGSGPCPGLSPDSLVQRGTRMRVRSARPGRVAHLPQKPKCYEIVCETFDNIIELRRPGCQYDALCRIGMTARQADSSGRLRRITLFPRG